MPASASVNDGIAVVGLAGRFPGASDVPGFWRNLVAGHDGLTRFTDAELAAAGYDPAALRGDPGFVPVRGVIDRPEWFDAAFFGISPKEAEVIDPQQRVFMETAWHALEDAGCDPARHRGMIGVYAGMTNNTYARFVRGRRDLVEAVGELAVTLGNEKDYLATRLAYKLDLRGPALSINTACSTSLVALATACQSLAGWQCDAALAGGVSITFPQTRGYFFREGGMTSPDGVCRPFEARAAGAVFSHGCAVIVLKRLADALAEGDQIYAVVKGWALNNDGAGKLSITAPSVNGQAEVVALAQALAGVAPECIGYLEAHGTGTALGDAIEVAALTQAFGGDGAGRQFCALGSLKSNVGHLEAASGAAGFIKAALALRHARIPATLHFDNANPELRLESSPFYIPEKTRDWPAGPEPRRAGVSSFGVGGTNAHVILEEAPQQPATTAGRATQLLTLSARTPAALDQAARDLAAHFETQPALSLADAAYTLQTGRQRFAHRRCIVAGGTTAAVAALRGETKLARIDDRQETPVAFLFPGQGSQYPRMGAQLHASEPAFRAAFDAVADALQPELGLDLRAAIFSGDAEELRQTRIAQPAIFALEYALAQMWLSFGLRPDALLGHSVGEYVAATLAGVFALEDAVRLVAARARLVQAQPGGAMLAVRLGEAEAQQFVSEQLSIAAINSSRLCVLSGPAEMIAAVEARLTAPARRLSTSHAFHSAMVAPVVAPFTELVRGVRLRPPQIPFVSNVTGTWITDAQATDPAYWAGHVRAAVRFADGVETLLAALGRALLEVGPGNALTQLARQHRARTAAHEFAHTLAEDADETATLATAQARLWMAGVTLDWNGVHAGEIRRRVSLPGYPFERQRYFADPPAGTPLPLTASATDGEPLVNHAAGIAAAPAATTPTSIATVAPEAAGENALGRLAALITELSGTDVRAADPATTLLDLGFDSLFLAQLIVVIQKRFGVRIALLDLFDDLGSLGALAAHLETHLAPPPAPTPPPRPPVEERAPMPAGPRPITEAQREVWLACQRSPLASAAFNETCTIQFHGALQSDTLRRALQTVVDRHEALRTSFSADGETQTAQPRLTIDVPFDDLSALPAAERDRRLRTWQEAEGPRHFDLTRGPLLAARLVKLAADHHALIFTAHHLACDGWSYDVVLRELGHIYTALCEGRAPALPAPMQMSDYQRWEEEQQRTETFAADRAWWLERFQTLPAPLDLPSDRPRPPQRSYAGAREHIILPAELYHEIGQLGAKLNATPFAVLLAAFQTLLFRLSGERDFVVGVPAAGQNLAGGADLVGHCVNLLALRTRVEDAHTFADFLHASRAALFEAFEHQRFNFGQLVRHLPLPRDPGRMPLVASTFNFNPPLRELRFVGLRHEIALNPRAAYQFDLSFNCYEQDGALRVDADFNTDLFDPATIRRWLAHYATLLRALPGDATKPVATFELLDDAVRAQVLAWSRGARTPYPAAQTIHARFGEICAAHPEAIALVDGATRLTYAELDRRANQYARHLHAQGLGAGAFIGLPAHRSWQFIAATLGILKIGAAYVPLDPGDPPARLAALRAHLDGDIAEQLDVSGESTEFAAAPGDPAGPAYVMFTSGSTGVPKGVIATHQGVMRLVCATDYAPLDAETVIMQGSNLCFDASTFELWGALLNGGKFIFTPTETLLDHDDLAAHFAEHGINTIFLTTALFNQHARQEPALLAGLRCVLFGGEAADPTMINRVLEHGRPQYLANIYGPTETTTFAVWHPITEKISNVPIGRPIANTDAFILDERRALVPPGVTGEIYIGGPGVALGYHREPGLTAERFIETAHGRLYRTGDFGRWLADGTIDFQGRIDQQFKLRGFRIEPAEIEAQVRLHPAVAQCVVVPKKSPSGEKVPIAYLVPRRGEAQPADADFRQHLVANLPPPFVPYQWFWLEKLPLTANGKLDQRALPEPTVEAKPLRAFEPPRNSVHAHLIEIWEEVLNRKPIGIRDDFFELGGHSLLAAKVIALISERLGQRLSFGEFFSNPTIEKHALGFSGARSDERQTDFVLINPEGHKTPVFFFHGDFVGGGFFCKTLARAIGEDRSFYAFHPHGLHGDPVPLTIEAMAAERLAQIRKTQPHGPYILGGYCNGALIAYQIARLLHEAGEEVAPLLMLNAYGTNVRFGWLKRLSGLSSAWRGEDEAAAQKRFLRLRRSYRDREDIGGYYARAAADLWRQPARVQLERVWGKARRVARRFAPGANAPSRHVPLAPAAPAAGNLSEIYGNASRAYIPAHYDGSIVLLWPREEPPPSDRGPAYGWEDVCDNISIIKVAGHHHSCIAQNANVLEVGEAMRTIIAQHEGASVTTHEIAAVC